MNYLNNLLRTTEHTLKIAVIDDNQTHYDQLIQALTPHFQKIESRLLDDQKSFIKLFNHDWDVIVYIRAFDLTVHECIEITQRQKSKTPIIAAITESNEALFNDAQNLVDLFDLRTFLPLSQFSSTIHHAFHVKQLIDEKMKNDQQRLNIFSQVRQQLNHEHNAIAFISEGIHLEANEEYLSLFGYSEIDELIGLPLIDVLQPSSIKEFKTQFNQVNQQEFDFEILSIQSTHPNLLDHEKLDLIFLKTNEPDTIQLIIRQPNTVSTPEPSLSLIDHAVQTVRQKQVQLSGQNYHWVAIQTQYLPHDLSSPDWNICEQYIENLTQYIEQVFQTKFIQPSTTTFIGAISNEHQLSLDEYLAEKLQDITSNFIHFETDSLPISLRWGELTLNSPVSSADDLINQLQTLHYNSTNIPSSEATNEFLEQDNQVIFEVQDLSQYELKIEEASAYIAPEVDIFNIQKIKADTHISSKPSEPPSNSTKPKQSKLEALKQAFLDQKIQLKFQQVYDKQDTILHNYEVTSGFNYHDQWINCTEVAELAQDDEFSIQLDRWVLLQSAKQLHRFISIYPNAKLIINLNSAILFKDSDFNSYFEKLIMMVNSKLNSPLILQFSELDLTSNLEFAQLKLKQLKDLKADIAVRDFGQSSQSLLLLHETDIQNFTLSESLSQQMINEENMEELQQKVLEFLDVRPIHIMLRNLNDMTSFANAWNIEARFIQGDYFQKKIPYLVDVQDQ